MRLLINILSKTLNDAEEDPHPPHITLPLGMIFFSSIFKDIFLVNILLAVSVVLGEMVCHPSVSMMAFASLRGPGSSSDWGILTIKGRAAQIHPHQGVNLKLKARHGKKLEVPGGHLKRMDSGDRCF